jgi:hypothetical protein
MKKARKNETHESFFDQVPEPFRRPIRPIHNTATPSILKKIILTLGGSKS